jgi:hypothetical protein
MSDPEPDEDTRTLVQIVPVDVADFSARLEGLGLTLSQVSGGGTVMATVEREGEETTAAFMGVVRLATAGAAAGAPPELDGGGMLGLSNQRVFGVLLYGNALGGRCPGVDRRGQGQVVVFSIEREAVASHAAIRAGRKQKLTRVNLLGDYCGIGFEATHRYGGMLGRFQKSDTAELLRVVEEWMV